MVTVLAILRSGRSDAGNFILFDKKLLIIIAQGEKAEGLSMVLILLIIVAQSEKGAFLIHERLISKFEVW